MMLAVAAAAARPAGTSFAFLAAIATRTLVVGLLVILGLRLSGTRELGQLTIYDLAAIMALSNAVQNAMTQGSGYLLAGLVSAGTLLLLVGLLTLVFIRFPPAERAIVGEPTLLVFKGRLLRTRLRHTGVSRAEVMTAIREHGLAHLNEVFSATLEVDGTISLVEKGPLPRPNDRGRGRGR
jgi:uncharacterized membrane protein YcaP (DUF421 family)